MLNENLNQQIVYTGGNIMPREKVNQLASHFVGSVSENNIHVLKSKFSLLPEDRFEDIISIEMKNPVIVLLLSLFLGVFGVDCFILGKVGKGVGKIILFIVSVFLWLGFIPLGIWWLVDVIRATKLTQGYNFNKISLAC